MIAEVGSAARGIARNEEGFGEAAKAAAAPKKRELKGREIDGEGVRRKGSGGGGIRVIAGDGAGAGDRLDAESRTQHSVSEAHIIRRRKKRRRWNGTIERERVVEMKCNFVIRRRGEKKVRWVSHEQ